MNLFEAVRVLKEKGGSVPTIVYASSAAVAGPSEVPALTASCGRSSCWTHACAQDYTGPVRDHDQHRPRTHCGFSSLSSLALPCLVLPF